MSKDFTEVVPPAAHHELTIWLAYHIGVTYGARARARAVAAPPDPEAVIAAFWSGSPYIPPPWAGDMVEAGIRVGLAGQDA